MTPSAFNSRSEAFAYLLALPGDTRIELPKEARDSVGPPEIKAVEMVSFQQATKFALSQKRWDWTAFELADALIRGSEVLLVDGGHKVEVLKLYKNGDVKIQYEDEEVNSVPFYEIDFDA